MVCKHGCFELLLLYLCAALQDAKRLLEVCKRCGPADQSLWVQVGARLVHLSCYPCFFCCMSLMQNTRDASCHCATEVVKPPAKNAP